MGEPYPGLTNYYGTLQYIFAPNFTFLRKIAQYGQILPPTCPTIIAASDPVMSVKYKKKNPVFFSWDIYASLHPILLVTGIIHWISNLAQLFVIMMD